MQALQQDITNNGIQSTHKAVLQGIRKEQLITCYEKEVPAHGMQVRDWGGML